MKKSIYLFIAFLFISLTACDSFLTTPPLDQLTEDQWWSNKEQVNMMVSGAYQYIYNENEVALRDCMSDNAKHRDKKYTEIGNGTYTTQAGAVKDEWKYASVAKLNYILEGIEKAKDKLSEAEYRRYTAEVRFIRAFVYYDLILFFGDVPLIKNTLTVSESRETSRQPREEVLAFVLSELEGEVLPAINALGEPERGRVNEQAVNAFLTRIYLFEKQYEKAVQYADKVIGSGNYALYPDYEELFRPQSDEANKEVIFERQYKSPLVVHALNRNLSPASSLYSGWSHVTPLQELVDDYECINGHAFADCQPVGCAYYQKRKDADAEKHRGEYDFRDPRLAATIMYPFWEWKVDGNVLSYYGVDDPDSKDNIKKESHSTGYLLTKWVDLKGEYADRTRAEKNMTIIRYADVLLMKAEALIELNQDLDQAAALITQIRERAGMPAIATATQAVLREKLRHERRIELAFEGLRYHDIIRWRIADKVKAGKVYGAQLKILHPTDHKLIEERFWSDKMYLFPIPQEARDNNENLTQNTGWE